MPVRKVKGGFRWGKHGKVYRSRAGAARQARAAYANGYRGDSGEFHLPVDHKPGMRVPGGPNGGARCSTCEYLKPDGASCGNTYFIQWNGSDRLPAPADEYCTDWYEPASAVDYRGDAQERRTARSAARALRANKRAELRYVRDLRGILGQVHQGFMKVLAPHVAARAPRTRQDVRAHDPDLAAVEVRMIHYIRQAVPPAFDRMSDAVDATNEKAAARLHGIPLGRTGVAADVARFRDQNIQLVENAGRAYAAQVREVFDDPDNYGLRVEDLAAKLEERGQVSTSRAELIARDQTLKLNAQLTESRQTSAGVERYRWSGSLDERERPGHRELEGQVFDWDDPPVTNDAGERNHPGEDFQCRCVAVPMIEELEDI